MVIRKATPEDAEKILEFSRQAGAETDNLSFGEDGLPFTVEDEQRFLIGQLNSEKDLFLVAEENGKIIATASYAGMASKRMAHRGEISLVVKKSEWGRHIGTMLMQKLMDFARNEAKAELVSLEVRSDNDRAIHLYEKFGFRKTGVFPGYMKIDDVLVDFDLMSVRLQ